MKDSKEPSSTCDCNASLAFGRRFARWRKSKRYPLKHVAAELGVSIQIVSDWERGRRFPSGKHLLMIESFTKVPLCQFFRAEGLPCPYADPPN